MKMNFFLQNEELDKQVKSIRRKIRLSMNGVVSDHMTEQGIIYKQNFGVAIPRLKEIAGEFLQNHDLAQRLWALKIRETMILATLVEPAEKFTPELATAWLSSLTNPEIIEQTCMNLFSKLDFAVKLSLTWMQSDKLWEEVTAFTLAARMWKDFDRKQTEQLLQRAFELSEVDNFHLYKSISVALSRLCRQGNSVSDFVMSRIQPFEKSTQISQKYIFSEVQNEISFLNF